MQVATGNLFKHRPQVEAIVIPTNGVVKLSGDAVMGAGVAKQAATLYPTLPRLLGQRILAEGNHVYFLWDFTPILISFPTKDHWRDPSRLDLIRQSAIELKWHVNRHHLGAIAMPKVGCGLGGLNWEDVRPILDTYLDDRFVVYAP